MMIKSSYLKWLMFLASIVLIKGVLGQEEGAHPPNFVIVIVDDAGIDDVGYNASPESAIRGKTPVLDVLASESVRLKEYYAHPVCTPTRAALLTGLYAVNVGMPFPLLAHPVGGIDPSTPTMAETLKTAGYRTHMVGKWHVGNAKRSMLPLNRGFDTFFGLLGGGFDHYTKDGGNVIDLWRGFAQVTEVDPTDHATNLFSREAIDVIQDHSSNHKDDPFFLYLGYSAPHDPLQADSEYLAKCADVPNVHRRNFCGMMAQLDDGIANVTQALKETGMWENTVFLFTSDNGGNPVSGGFNYPYRGMKSTAWEGGSRVPGFVHAPSRFGFQPRDFYGMVHVADWMPTFLGLARIQGPEKTDGHDLSDAFRSPSITKSPRSSVLMQYDVFLNSTAYRSGCHKMLLGCPGGCQTYLEPDQHLLRVKQEDKVKAVRSFPPLLEKFAGLFVERGFDLIEAFVRPPVDQFLKYVIVIQLARFRDWWFGSSYNHILNTDYQNLTMWKADLKEQPPVLDFHRQKGIKTFLFNICDDPEETYDLTEQPEGQARVKEMYTELLDVIKDAPIQYAGDTILLFPGESTPDRRQRVEPFLDDDVDIASLTIVDDRLFHLLGRAFTYVGIALLVLSTLFTLLIGYCICGPRRISKKKGGAATKAKRS